MRAGDCWPRAVRCPGNRLAWKRLRERSAWKSMTARRSAYRVLRHQPHPRRIDGRLLRRLSGKRDAKSEYRRFNIKDIQPGDDYAAIRQAVFAPLRKAAEQRERRADA
jgi:hypothetical protein